MHPRAPQSPSRGGGQVSFSLGPARQQFFCLSPARIFTPGPDDLPRGEGGRRWAAPWPRQAEASPQLRLKYRLQFFRSGAAFVQQMHAALGLATQLLFSKTSGEVRAGLNGKADTPLPQPPERAAGWLDRQSWRAISPPPGVAQRPLGSEPLLRNGQLVVKISPRKPSPPPPSMRPMAHNPQTCCLGSDQFPDRGAGSTLSGNRSEPREPRYITGSSFRVCVCLGV